MIALKVSVGHLLKAPMGESVDYRVEEAPIDPRGENAEMLDADITSIEADIKATHTNPGALLEGDARAQVQQQCARCLKPISSAVETSFAEQFYAKLNVETGAPMPEPPHDAKMIGHDFQIDLTPLLREEVILATPQAPLCRPDCKGLYISSVFLDTSRVMLGIILFGAIGLIVGEVIRVIERRFEAWRPEIH